MPYKSEYKRDKMVRQAVKKVLHRRTKYIQRVDGEGWEVEPGKIFKLACCDCGLVHNVIIVEEDGEIGMAAERNNRATGQRRRYMKGKL